MATSIKTPVGQLKYVFIKGEGRNQAMPGEAERMQYVASIVFPKNIVCKYDMEKNICTLDFVLPKGSYATVLVEFLANRNFS